MTSRALGGGGVGFGAKEEVEWIREDIVGGGGKINAAVTTDGSKVASNNP